MEWNSSSGGVLLQMEQKNGGMDWLGKYGQYTMRKERDTISDSQ